LMRDIDANNKSRSGRPRMPRPISTRNRARSCRKLGNKVMAVIEKYATQNGFALVLDVSNPQDARALGGLGNRYHQ